MSTSPPIPLAWFRVVVLTVTSILSIVSTALCIQLFKKQIMTHHHLNAAVPPGIKVDLKYTDVENTTILLFLSGNLLTMVAGHTVLFLIEDMFHIFPLFIIRRFKLENKQLSTSTLPLQAGALLLSFVFVTLSLSFMTAFVFTGSMTVVVKMGTMQLPTSTIQTELNNLHISTIYRHTSYIKSAMIASWPSVGFAILSIPVTFVAWYKARQNAKNMVEMKETQKDVEKDLRLMGSTSENSIPRLGS